MQHMLVRHATAVPSEVSPERPLSSEGREEAERVAQRLAAVRAIPKEARILTSPKRRARETAEILAQALELQEPETDDQLVPNADPMLWAERLFAAEHPLVLVGHLPLLGRLAGYLLCGSRDREPIAFAPASIACFVRERAGMRLLWHLTPSLA